MIQNGIQEQDIQLIFVYFVLEIRNRPVFQELMEEELKPNGLLMVTKIDSFLFLLKTNFDDHAPFQFLGQISKDETINIFGSAPPY